MIRYLGFVAAAVLFWTAHVFAQGYAYSNNGLSWRAVANSSAIGSGEVYFSSPPNSTQLATAFPAGSGQIGYTAAVAAQSAQATFNSAIASGLAITSSGTPAASGTYALDPVSQSQLYQIAIFGQTYGTFPNGQSTIAYPDNSGTQHTLTVALANSILQEVAAYVYNLNTTLATLQAGGSASWPTASATIP